MEINPIADGQFNNAANIDAAAELADQFQAERGGAMMWLRDKKVRTLIGLAAVATSIVGVVHESPAVALSAPQITGVGCESFSPQFNNTTNPEYLKVDFQNGPTSIALDVTFPGYPNGSLLDQPEPPNATRSDLWSFQSGVQVVYSVHNGPQIGEVTMSLADCTGQTLPPPPPPSQTGDTVAIATTDGPNGPGEITVDSAGVVTTHGSASFQGDLRNVKLNSPIVGAAEKVGGSGYWLAAADGGVFAFNAPYEGSMGGTHLNLPIVAMAANPNGDGYWLTAGDGGIFSFGNAPFAGSTGSMHLNKPVVGIASKKTGDGYWLVASDGGIFAFNAPFEGSMGGQPLNKPVVGMSTCSNGDGYFLVAADAGNFAEGCAFPGTELVPDSDPAVSVGTLNNGDAIATRSGRVIVNGS